MARFRLASVLRARQVQEDAARGAVLRARADSEEADAEVIRRDRVLAAGNAPSAASAGAFVAALCARQGMALELSAARVLSERARQSVAECVSDYTDASIRRRGVEKLGERHAAEARAAEEAADQRELDDLATTAHVRRGPQPN
jgi:flagellar export protein FliJ